MGKCFRDPLTVRSRVGAATLLVTFCAFLFGVVAHAQWQVNNQIYGNPGPSVKYGYGPGYQQYPTSNLMPSEWRNAAVQSGALPSSIRMNYVAVGPMAPQGNRAYIPASPQYSQARVGTVGNYVPPNVPRTGVPGGVSTGVRPTVPPPSPVPRSTMNGSVHYSGAPSATLAPVQGFTFNSAPVGPPPTMAQIMSAPASGSVRYATGG